MKREKGFTLIELMVVVVIIAVLAGIALPRFMNEAKRARESACWDTMTEIQKALGLYMLWVQSYPATLDLLQTPPSAAGIDPLITWKVDIDADSVPDTPWSTSTTSDEYGYATWTDGYSLYVGATYAAARTAVYENKGLQFRFPP